MKSIVIILMVAGSLTACNNSQPVAAIDTRGDSLQMELTKRHIVDSINADNAAKSSDGTAVSNSATQKENTTVVHHYNSTYTGKTPATAAPAPAEKKKKGWSATAKGAVIGAGVGGITGAMVNKKKGEGAIVGGILGAGTGAGVGAIIDRSKKNKENKED